MALVAYDYDSSSGNEEENDTSLLSTPPETKKSVQEVLEEKTKENTTLLCPKTRKSVQENVEDKIEENDTSLLSILPKTKKNFQEVVEDKIEDFIPKPPPLTVKKEKQKVRITIPSLSQFEDNEDEPEIKKTKPSTKTSGLLALLPPVKGSIKSSTSFLPKVVADQTKTKPALTSNAFMSNVPRKQVERKEKIHEKPKVVFSDAESDDDLDVPDTYDDAMWEKVCGRPKPKPIVKEVEEPKAQESINIAPEPEKPYDGLDNQAFKKLVGSSRRPIGNIKLIDIHEEEILPDKDLWMTKSLTDPELAPKPVIEDPVDPTRRRKHHITYLAQQAKANEQELKNQWAANKNNKFATRAKYGF